jgi:hypothetical protein
MILPWANNRAGHNSSSKGINIPISSRFIVIA